jgi:predicted porin
MKKLFATLGVLGGIAGSTGICNSAVAQTAVTVYGLTDAGLVRESGGPLGSVTKISSGVKSGSRLGFKGSEDLGSGLSSFFVLEMGTNIDTGVSGQGGVLFGRQAFVGLSSADAGSISMGRVYTPLYLALSTIDPFGASSTAGSSNNIMSIANIRMNNTVRYLSPTFSGFSGELAYGMGEVAGDANISSQYGATASYVNGPVNIKLSHGNLNQLATPTAPSNNGKTTMLGGTYDFKVAKIAFAYAINKGRTVVNGVVNVRPDADTRDTLLGITIPFGPHTILGSIIHKQDKNGTNQSADQIAVGYAYSLSKQTDLYAAYGYIRNKAAPGAAGFLTVGNASDTGTGNKALNLGIRHTF